MPDDQVARIEADLASADRPTLARWVRELLDDRRARSALLLGQTRRLSYTRRRLRQAFRYLDGLLVKAVQEAQAAWPSQLPCPQCGAPLSGVRAEQTQQGHAIVHDHPDGMHCGQPPHPTR